MAFAKLLKELREDRRMTQQVLADAAGLTKQTVWMLEQSRNKPQPETVIMLARGLATNPHGTVDLHEEQDCLTHLWSAAGFPWPPTATQPQHDGMESLLRDFPELREELALFLHGNPQKADLDFVVAVVRRERERLGIEPTALFTGRKATAR